MGYGQNVKKIQTGARTRVHEGVRRMQDGFFQSLQIVVSGIGAYLFAEKVLGHTEPIFAATAAIVSLGYITGATHARLGGACEVAVCDDDPAALQKAQTEYAARSEAGYVCPIEPDAVPIAI